MALCSVWAGSHRRFVLLLVIAANWVRSRYFSVGSILLMAWLQLAFMVVLCFSGVARNYDFHPDWF
jgi:hypothetical protein